MDIILYIKDMEREVCEMVNKAVNKDVLVIMGSDSDFPVMEACIKQLKAFGLSYEVEVCSAHRTPERAAKLAGEAKDEGYKVIIAAAGKAAHLAGVMAAFTILPIIGVPMKSSTLDGLDSLLSIVQMPSGVPVATVAINGAQNAAILAAQIIALTDENISNKVKEFKESLKNKVRANNELVKKKVKEI